MSNSVTPPNESPFDALRLTAPAGTPDRWSARDLVSPLGYERWQRFEETIERAMTSAANSGIDVSSAFKQVAQLTNAGNLGEQSRIDYHLTRHAAYLVVMNGDPRKPEIAAAQSYFAIKTREAEVAPARGNQFDFMRSMLNELEATAGRMAAVEQRQLQLEAKVSAAQGEHAEFTTLAYAKLNDLPTDRVSCQKHGKRASKLMRSRGQGPRRVQDATFGFINIYPADVLEETAES